MKKSKEHKKRGIIATIIVHLVLLLIFMFTGLTIPVPLPEEEGLPVQLDLGNTDFGSGDEQPQSTKQPDETEPITEPQPVESAPVEAPEEVATQEDVSDMSVPEQTKPVEKPVEKKPELDERLKKALSNPFQTNKDNDSKGQGSTDQAGDHGKPNGSPDGSSLTGTKAGGGISASLGGRAAKNLRPIPGNWQESGMIKITVIVDRNGKVVSASQARGTTITNSALINAAIAEAMKVKFTPMADAPAEQRGVITYPIYLQ